MPHTRRRIWLPLGLAALLLGVATAAYLRISADRRFQLELDQARAALEAHRVGTARRLLDPLVSRRPRDGRAAYLLGLAESGLGHAERAEQLFTLAMSLDSPDAGAAALRLAEIQQARGDLTGAADSLRRSIALPGPHRPYARWDYVRLLRLEGHFHEAARVFRQGLAEHPEPEEALEVLLKFESDAYPAEFARQQLEEALRRSPGDRDTLLGLASNAVRTGRLDDAKRLLDQAIRPDDPDPIAWRTRLDWALAADLPDEVALALEHLPASEDPDTRALVLSTRAWLARHDGDTDAEQAALLELDALTAGRPDVLDRLAQLALERGDHARAESLRARRADRERALRAYMDATIGPDDRSRASDLARLAEAVGRPFDADAWRALAEPGDPTARLADVVSRLAPPPDPSRTLASIVGQPASRAATAPAPDDSNPAPSPRFEDVAAASGLAAFVHDPGHVDGRLALPETGAGGLALLDYDGDGWLDVYAVQAGPFPPPAGARSADRLFRNRGDGTFEDATERAGLPGFPGGYGHGAASGDFDDDGHPDLFITRWRSYQLLRNRGNGTFEDATEPAGLSGDRDWPTSAAFADLDNDGDLDLYVCHYLAWDEVHDRTCVDPAHPGDYRCKPLDFPARPDHVFRNDDGRFTDVTSQAGFTEDRGRGLGVVAADLDGDLRVELFVANDMSANFLWRPQGPLSFADEALASGVACNATGGYQAGMGVGCGDLDGDGRLDLLVTNYYAEGTTFFRNLGDGYFADHSAALGLAAPSLDRLGFGLVLLDADNDGRLDLLTANGHVHDGRPNYPWKMRPQLFAGTPQGRLRDATDSAGPALDRPVLGRALAHGDLDNDGLEDAVLLAQGEPLIHLRNVTPGAGHSVSFRLVGTASNRDAVGATVVINAGGRTQVACRAGGGSFQSASDPRLHFGLGSANLVSSAEIRWPSGRVDRHDRLDAGRTYTLREGDASPLEVLVNPSGTTPP